MGFLDKENAFFDDDEKEMFEYIVWDGKTYDISNPGLPTYDEMEQFCQNKSGNLVSVDSSSKFNMLKKLIKDFQTGKKDLKYLIGNLTTLLEVNIIE